MTRMIFSNSFRRLPGTSVQALLLVPVLMAQTFTLGQPQPFPRLDLADDCTGWIGVLKDSQYRQEPRPQEPGKYRWVSPCPKDWEPVFPGEPPPPGLQRFCRYVGDEPDPRPGERRQAEREKHPGRPDEPGRERQPEPALVAWPWFEYEHFERIDRDCLIVGPAAQTIWDTAQVSQVLTERFLQEAGGDRPQPQPVSDRVRLAIIDSVQDDEKPEERKCQWPTPDASSAPLGPMPLPDDKLECSPHGEVLVKLCRQLLCDEDDNCSAEITSQRALRRTHRIRSADSPADPVDLGIEDTQEDTAQGGAAGTPGDLAAAIRRAVESWWASDREKKLILNLSVGWERSRAPDSPVVRAALQDASCRGALVIAAAGNRVAGPAYLETPLLPAAWERLPAPSPQQCRALLEPSAQLPPESVTLYRPLLYAVGGVGQNGSPLSNSRPHATPRLVAYGDHATVYDSGSSPPRLMTLTGTSVSTLVVSAAAAQRWRQNGNLSSFDVIQVLWDQHQNQEVEGSVDFWLKTAQQPAKARRVYVYAPVSGDAWPAGKPALVESVMAETETISLNEAVQIELPRCDPETLNLTADTEISGRELCPQRLFDLKVKPALGPQPGANPCSGCKGGQGSPMTIILEFDPCYRVEGKPAAIDNFVLIVGSQGYRLPIPGFRLGDPATPCPATNDDLRRRQFIITDLPTLENPPHPMYLAFRVNGNWATLSPMLQVLATE